MSNKVLADGAFDPLHYGHIRYLCAARELGNVVVHIAPDEAISNKGRKPFQSRLERSSVVGALKYVSDTRAFGTLCDAIRSERPTFLVKGVEWAGKLPQDVVQACRDNGTTIVYLDTQERTSTERLAG